MPPQLLLYQAYVEQAKNFGRLGFFWQRTTKGDVVCPLPMVSGTGIKTASSFADGWIES